MSYTLQKIGTGILAAALILLFLTQYIFCYIALGIVLAIDLWLVIKKEKTITQWFRSFFPRKVDTILTIALAGVFIYMNPLFGLYFLMGTINGHLNGDW